jgi:hypothetical protein
VRPGEREEAAVGRRGCWGESLPTAHDQLKPRNTEGGSCSCSAGLTSTGRTWTKRRIHADGRAISRPGPPRFMLLAGTSISPKVPID